MDIMPRPRPPYLQLRKTRLGGSAWYVRLGRGPLVRIRGVYGSPEFMQAYESAVRGEPLPPPNAPKQQTVAWLINLHRSSSYWENLAQSTRKQREGIFRAVIDSSGSYNIRTIDKQAIINARDRRKKSSQARHFLETMRSLFKWALDCGLVPSDPTFGIETKRKKTSGIPVWTDDDIAKYEMRWPRGTRERVMFDLFLYTGLRIGDVTILGRQHAKGGVIAIDTEKSGMRVTIPILRPLQLTLDAGPTGDLTFISRASGKGFTKGTLGDLFRKACIAAGVPKSAHGLRKAAATHAADQGATVSELEAIFGWAGGQMAALYTRSANRKALAAGAIEKLNREPMLPHFDGEVASFPFNKQNQPVKK